MSLLENKLQQVLPHYIEEVSRLRRDQGGLVIDEVAFGQAAGGMRGVKALVCDTSNVDPQRGLYARLAAGDRVYEYRSRASEEMIILWREVQGEPAASIGHVTT